MKSRRDTVGEVSGRYCNYRLPPSRLDCNEDYPFLRPGPAHMEDSHAGVGQSSILLSWPHSSSILSGSRDCARIRFCRRPIRSANSICVCPVPTPTHGGYCRPTEPQYIPQLETAPLAVDVRFTCRFSRMEAWMSHIDRRASRLRCQISHQPSGHL